MHKAFQPWEDHASPSGEFVQLDGLRFALSLGMTWLTVLIVVVIVAAVAAITGITPGRARPVARTQLMGVARFTLLVFVAILIYAAWRWHSAG